METVALALCHPQNSVTVDLGAVCQALKLHYSAKNGWNRCRKSISTCCQRILYTKQRCGRDIYVGSDCVISHNMGFASKRSWLLLIYTLYKSNYMQKTCSKCNSDFLYANKQATTKTTKRQNRKQFLYVTALKLQRKLKQ